VRSSGSDGQDGFLTIQYLLAVGLSLVLLASLGNLLVFSYGRGVVRAALDEGVRAGSRAGASPAECQARADAVLSDLLSGSLGQGVDVRCQSQGGTVTASAEASFPAWAPLVPSWSFTTTAEAVAEPAR
jgi:hypothetical protein